MTNQKSPNHKIPIVNNLVIAVILIIAFYQIKDMVVGYQWVEKNLIGSNLETIGKYGDWTFEQRQEAKLGFNVRFLRFVAENTPEDAIILMPPNEVLTPAGQQANFDKHIRNKVWCSYFLYPRKVVYEREKDKSEIYSRVTHIAIVNGWGYDKLEYQVSNKNPFAVLPINPSN